MWEENWVLTGIFMLFNITLTISTKNEIILPGKGFSLQTVHFTSVISITKFHVWEIPQ